MAYLSDINLQRGFLAKCVKKGTVKKRKRIRAGSTQNTAERQPNNSYSLPVSDKKIVAVCKKFFLHVLNIDANRINSALNSLNPETGFITPDKRADGKTANRITKDRITKVMEHIMLVDTVESHYVRNGTANEYQYLPRGLTIKQMWRDYKEWCVGKEYSPENYDFYLNITKTKFNLKKHQPKKDRCDTCVKYENTTQKA